ncbi:hypothetical protein U5801_10575 [Lamprobacter modestohalophilus]|uniref:hypothetical protein n=1 Tax=Lamprobacter modestohalophilus TaxID=1064514 RepID=UPI002ADED383|nr:hypothetical protein [Lamprobacter modestohalophilus]MEA1050248.1 hypothetical protein [Lamprobacter modestohalophilus]
MKLSVQILAKVHRQVAQRAGQMRLGRYVQFLAQIAEQGCGRRRIGDIEIRQPPLAEPFAPQESVAILGPRSGDRSPWPNPNAIAFQLEIALAAPHQLGKLFQGIAVAGRCSFLVVPH